MISNYSMILNTAFSKLIEKEVFCSLERDIIDIFSSIECISEVQYYSNIVFINIWKENVFKKSLLMIKKDSRISPASEMIVVYDTKFQSLFLLFVATKLILVVFDKFIDIVCTRVEIELNLVRIICPTRSNHAL